MRGLLHVLWDRAELTHWHPKMAGKRTWFVVRRAALARVYASRDEMMVVVGEIKEIVPAHGAEKIVLRHVGDMPFVMDQDMARRFHKRFAGELALWQAQDGPNGKSGRLVLAGSFARRREGTFDLIEVALMPMTPEWLPYETSDERYLVGKASRICCGRRASRSRPVSAGRRGEAGTRSRPPERAQSSDRGSGLVGSRSRRRGVSPIASNASSRAATSPSCWVISMRLRPTMVQTASSGRSVTWTE